MICLPFYTPQAGLPAGGTPPLDPLLFWTGPLAAQMQVCDMLWPRLGPLALPTMMGQVAGFWFNFAAICCDVPVERMFLPPPQAPPKPIPKVEPGDDAAVQRERHQQDLWEHELKAEFAERRRLRLLEEAEEWPPVAVA